MGKVLAPLGAFVAARLLFAAAAAALGQKPFDATLLRRWDSGQYVSFATRGYELVECARIGYAPDSARVAVPEGVVPALEDVAGPQWPA